MHAGRPARSPARGLTAELDGGCREEALALSFNGGKDCTVLLHLYAAVLAKRRRDGTSHRPTHATAARPDDVPLSADVYTGFAAGLGQDPAAVGEPRVRAVYIFQPDPFSEVEAFLDECAVTYHLRIAKICTASMRAGLEQFLQQEPEVRAILVGTRRSDPYSGNARFKERRRSVGPR